MDEKGLIDHIPTLKEKEAESVIISILFDNNNEIINHDFITEIFKNYRIVGPEDIEVSSIKSGPRGIRAIENSIIRMKNNSSKFHNIQNENYDSISLTRDGEILARRMQSFFEKMDRHGFKRHVFFDTCAIDYYWYYIRKKFRGQKTDLIRCIMSKSFATERFPRAESKMEFETLSVKIINSCRKEISQGRASYDELRYGPVEMWLKGRNICPTGLLDFL